MNKFFIGCMAVVAAFTVTLTGCDAKHVSYGGPSYLMFSDTIYNYPVQESGETFKVPVSATVKAGHDRTFAVEVIDKESNAIEGKHYKLLSNNVTIKAGEMSGCVEVQGMYDNIEINDSIGFAMRLVIPEETEWDMYGIDTKVVLTKIKPFDINNFTGYCKLTSSYYLAYVPNTEMRLVKTELAEGEENTVLVRSPYYKGYDIKLKFETGDVNKPFIKMDETQCGNTGEAFGTIYGDGKLMMTQPTLYTSYYSTNENFAFQYVTLDVYNKDESHFGTVGTYINIFEWISDAEAEDLMQQGFKPL